MPSNIMSPAARLVLSPVTIAFCLFAASGFAPVSHVAAQTASLNVDTSLGNSPYSLTDGTLSTTGTAVGTTSTGVFNQSGGTHTTNGAPLNLGSTATGNGTYTLSGPVTGSRLTTGAVYIGNLGVGTFNQNGGTFTANAPFYLGFGDKSNGTFNLSGTGSLSTGIAFVGNVGVGAFNQNGGTFTIATAPLVIGANTGSNGTYTLSGGTLSTASTTVGSSGNGIFVQTGGTHSATSGIILGSGTSGAGTYTLSGGVLQTVRIARQTGGATFNFNGGTVQALGDNTGFMAGLTSATVQAGGAKIDTNGHAITISAGLLHDTSLKVSPDGGLTKLGAGTLTLVGVNTYNGGTVISAGTLSVNTDANLGDKAGAVTLQGSGQLAISNESFTTARTYNLGNGTLTPAASGTITYASGASVNGGFLGTGGTHVFQAGSSLNGTVAGPGTALSQTEGTTTFNHATISGTLTQVVTSTLNFSNGYVTSAGTLNVNGIVNTSNAELDGVTQIGVTQPGNGAALNNTGGNLVLGGGSRTTVGAGFADPTFNGLLSTVAGTSIELNGGLLVNNGRQTGVLNVNFGGVAKGSGTFGTVNVTDGGRFSPGNSPGTATVASLNLGAGGSYQFELSTAHPEADPSRADLINVTGTLTLSAGVTANSRFTVALVSLDGGGQSATLGDFDPSQSYRFTLATTAGINGYDANEFTVDASGFRNDLAGGSFSVVQDGNNLVLQFTPVPEPGTWAWLLAGSAFVLVFASKKRVHRKAC